MIQQSVEIVRHQVYMAGKEIHHMARVIANGEQSFEAIVKNNSFYVDKTNFIKEWWENADSVTLITRPRRFGKTLTMNMLECFFSIKYEGQGELFSGLNIWNTEKYRQLQGTYPVINISFADIKSDTYDEAIAQINQMFFDLYSEYEFLMDSDIFSERDRTYFERVDIDMPQTNATVCLRKLCCFLQRYYRKKVILLLDEYDTPMQEAYVHGYWDELTSFIRRLFHSTFKTNPYLERAIMTGITRVSKESIFSDLNHLEVVTTTSNKYEDSFGFTQEEVSAALQEFGLSDEEETVKEWYDGFNFGDKTDIYNPWSIANFLDKKKIGAYWVNTSGNGLVNELIRRGNKTVKTAMEDLLKGGTLHAELDEQIVFKQLDNDDNESAIWSLFLASGYLKVECCQINMETGRNVYDLKLINKEVRIMFRNMIESWFKNSNIPYNDFIKALLSDDKKLMNKYMNGVALGTFSFFDTGKALSETTEPERFYHGFVLGLMVDLADRYTITSNRKSGYGRYDVMLKPKEGKEGINPAILMEFKVHDPEDEKTLEETVASALGQIRKKNYAAALIAEGIPEERIREYGFAFEGKKVLIGGGCIRGEE